MKRDMDLVRLILLEIEKSSEDPRSEIRLQIPNYTFEQVSYHIMIMHEADLIEADDLSTMGSGSVWFPKRLTWYGHEFLDAARNDSIWKQAMKKANNVGFELLKELLLNMTRQQLGAEP